MYQRGESPLFTPLPEAALEGERRVLQREKETKRTAPAAQHIIPAAPAAPGDRLAAAARALAKKKQNAAQEDQDGQFNLFSAQSSAPSLPEADALPKEPEEAADSQSPWWNDYNGINEANPDSIVLFQAGDFFEMYGEDARTAAALLDLNLTTKPIIGTMRVEMCGVPSHMLDQTVEKLRASHDVTVAPVEAQIGKRQPYITFEEKAGKNEASMIE